MCVCENLCVRVCVCVRNMHTCTCARAVCARVRACVLCKLCCVLSFVVMLAHDFCIDLDVDDATTATTENESSHDSRFDLAMDTAWT